MKKDIFNGKISHDCRGLVKFTLIFPPLIFILCGLLFLFTAIFYDNVEYAARIFLYCAAFLSLGAGVGYPVLTLFLIRIYPKGRKITKFLIREYVFKDGVFFTNHKDKSIDG